MGYLTEHNVSKQFILNAVKEHDNVLVMTHHAPTSKSTNRDHSGNGLDYAYFSDLSGLILDNESIRGWIHGHTHIRTVYDVGQCTVMANCRGYYPHERCAHEFKGLQHLEV